jgi:hypothetical protein
VSEANKELAKRFFEEVWNKSRRGAIAEILAPNAVIYESGEAIRPRGILPVLRQDASDVRRHPRFIQRRHC